VRVFLEDAPKMRQREQAEEDAGRHHIGFHGIASGVAERGGSPNASHQARAFPTSPAWLCYALLPLTEDHANASLVQNGELLCTSRLLHHLL
jgi:hypothetical protein